MALPVHTPSAQAPDAPRIPTTFASAWALRLKSVVMRAGPVLFFALLLPSLALAVPPSRWIPAAPPRDDAQASELPQVAAPPAWIQWLGWSEDGKRVAWRQGPANLPRRPGLPIEVAKVDASGAFVDRLHVTENILAVLNARRITVGPAVASEQVTPGDVLLASEQGKLLAVAVRGEPAIAAILLKRGGTYQPIARWNVRSPATRMSAQGYEDSLHRLLAVVATTGTGTQAQAHLVLLPLVDLPDTPSKAAP